MGESVTEATITNWLKNPGENVSLDEPLVEVATDKVDNELPSEAEGILVKQLFNEIIAGYMREHGILESQNFRRLCFGFKQS